MDRLISESKKRGMYVIMDLVVNHWFSCLYDKHTGNERLTNHTLAIFGTQRSHAAPYKETTIIS